MKIAVDSSVLIDIFSPDPVHGQRSELALDSYGVVNELVVCEAVVGELARILRSADALASALVVANIRFEPMSLKAAWLAGKNHIDYQRRGGKRVRVLSDFLIGAHAFVQCDALLTRDRGFYRDYFDGLNIIEP